MLFRSGENMPPKEHLLSINTFDMPKILDNAKAVLIWVKRLIIMEPGDDLTRPDMGLGLFSKYKYGWEDDVLRDLPLNLTKQILVYMPQYSNVSVDVQVKGNELYIAMNIDNETFILKTDSANNTIISLNDLK